MLNPSKNFKWSNICIQSSRSYSTIDSYSTVESRGVVVYTYWPSWALVYYKFFGSLFMNFGVFSGRYWGNTLKFAKTPSKKGYFCYFCTLSIQFGLYGIFVPLIKNLGDFFIYRVIPWIIAQNGTQGLENKKFYFFSKNLLKIRWFTKSEGFLWIFKRVMLF